MLLRQMTAGPKEHATQSGLKPGTAIAELMPWVVGYCHVCGRRAYRYPKARSRASPEPYPRSGMQLWPRALPRPLRFHPRLRLLLIC